MKTTLSYINKLLIEEDIEGLIASGAPIDEYESEAEEIADAVNKLTSGQFNEDNILSIISLVWLKSFDLSPEELELRLNSIRKITKTIKSSVG